MMVSTAARIGLILALAASAGCREGDEGGGPGDAGRGRLAPDSRAVIYDDEVKTLYIGKSMREVAVGAFRAVRGRDYARVDMRVAPDGQPFILEVNPNPDLAHGAAFAMCAEASGRTYAETLGAIADVYANKRLFLTVTVLGGAGAAGMSTSMIVRGESTPHPQKNSVRLSPGLGFLKNIIIDQHFTERGRISRLITAVSYNPYNLGIGIDENTAINPIEYDPIGNISSGRIKFLTDASQNVIGRPSSRITRNFNQRLPGVCPSISHSNKTK